MKWSVSIFAWSNKAWLRRPLWEGVRSIYIKNNETYNFYIVKLQAIMCLFKQSCMPPVFYLENYLLGICIIVQNHFYSICDLIRW
jgi:hypothetical protein